MGRGSPVCQQIREKIIEMFKNNVTFTFTHLADAFIQSDLQCIQAIHVIYKLYAANAMLYH